MSQKFPSYIQHDQMDCGPACLKILAKYYGKDFSMKLLRDRCYITREGVSLFDIGRSAESIGLRTLALKVDFKQLKVEIPLPVIVHWKQSHFVVVYKITSKRVNISDPAKGLISYTHDEFVRNWENTTDTQGSILVLEPSPDFFEQDECETSDSIVYFLKYLKPHQKYLIQVFLGVLAAILIGLFTPFIQQSIVDFGIGGGNIKFINVMLIAGLILVVSSTFSSFIQGRLMLYVSERVNIRMTSDFLRKILMLPMPFFERKMVSDIITRVSDHNRIQAFIMETVLGVAVNIILFVVYGTLMLYYNTNMFLAFLIGTAMYVGWIYLFLNKRVKLDNQLFESRISNSNDLLELLECVNEIKVNNIQEKRRWKWERSRFKIYGLRAKNLNLNQAERTGVIFIAQVQNIVILYIAASNVIAGTMTLGMMMAANYILGQLSGPVENTIKYVRSLQLARLSVKRVNEIILEEQPEKSKSNLDVPVDKSISIQDLSFKYNPNLDKVLDNVSITIPEGKVTAIVGESGSGKTTLLKLLMRFYENYDGKIQVGRISIDSIDLFKWRKKCGVVSQDGKLFDDTILYNITLEEDESKIDRVQLSKSTNVANIAAFIDKQALKIYTKVGSQGVGISQGQKQRILIARAVYKDPDFIFLDEATNSLDANNERKISENLGQLIEGKTAVIVAHRMSTVKKAYNIVVLSEGKVVEEGNHDRLIEQQGHYYQLVSNQLNL